MYSSPLHRRTSSSTVSLRARSLADEPHTIVRARPERLSSRDAALFLAFSSILAWVLIAVAAVLIGGR